jgi:hypothetical protein
VQEKILDVWFRGTKRESFIRSLNRWGFRRVFYHALPESALAFHHPSFAKSSTAEQLKTMKMSKSSKVSNAIATVSSSNAKASQKDVGFAKNPSANAGFENLSSQVAQVPMATLPSFQRVINGSNNLSAAASASGSQQMLLKLLNGQRVALGSDQRIQPLSSLHGALSSTASQHRSQLLVLRAKQELQQQQHQQEQEAKLRLALLAFQQGRSSYL